MRCSGFETTGSGKFPSFRKVFATEKCTDCLQREEDCVSDQINGSGQRGTSGGVQGDHSNPRGFWNGGPPSRRPSSVASMHSRSSSMNSSLRGSGEFDLREQKDGFSLPKVEDSWGLPPPPVDLGNTKSFDCDICGRVVQVKRRSEWQWVSSCDPRDSLTLMTRRHVMDDLKPYLCTFPDCSQADTTYISRRLYVNHEWKTHMKWKGRVDATKIENSCCPFCQEQLAYFDTRVRGCHIGRHMEEIAFNIVPKPYKDWEFYSDSSHGQPVSHARPRGRSQEDRACPGQSERDRQSGRHRIETTFAVVPKPYDEGMFHLGPSSGKSATQTSPYESMPVRKCQGEQPGNTGRTYTYGCTYPYCFKTFDSRDDWKRHESTHHYRREFWRCQETDHDSLVKQCAQIFLGKEQFQAHLRDMHLINDHQLIKTRRGRNSQERFWCGFCIRVVVLENRDFDAWKERYDHIEHHFEAGRKIGDWDSRVS